MNIRNCVIEAFEEILERMAFLYFEELEDASDAVESNQYEFVTEISFSGILIGTLNLFMTNDTGNDIARNLLGIRENDDLLEGTMDDAICEFTNMVMGRTMTLIDSAQSFKLGVPFITKYSETPVGGANTLEIVGTLEDHPFMLLLQYRSA